MKPLKPMLLTLVKHWPKDGNWIYEVKYDGYRGQLMIDSGGQADLISRNLKTLSPAFPEIIADAVTNKTLLQHSPLVLDGEVCLLRSEWAADFDGIQKRGRLKKAEKIMEISQIRPAVFVAFDLLMFEGDWLIHKPLKERKQMLNKIINSTVAPNQVSRIQRIKFFTDADELWDQVQNAKGEGIVAKHLRSKWEAGVRTRQWLKIKNMQTGVFILLAYDKSNGYFHVGLIKDTRIKPVGLFSHGLTDNERKTLIEVMKKNKSEETEQFIAIEPSICIELEYLEWYKEELRHPRFSSFKLDWNWEDCTWEAMKLNK